MAEMRVVTKAASKVDMRGVKMAAQTAASKVELTGAMRAAQRALSMVGKMVS